MAWVFLGVVTSVVVLLTSQCSRSSEDILQRHRNLGKAFYENPITHAETIAEFKRALHLTPNSPQENLNYALARSRSNWSSAAQCLRETPC